MPDWFYRTVSKPILFSLPAPRARDLALGFMGALSRLPLGPYLIDFLGHMRADPRLRQSFLDTTFPTSVGIGPWLDAHAVAVHALSRFGVGFIEIGPVTLDRNVAARSIRRIEDQEAFWIDDDPDSISLIDCNRRLRRISDIAVPVIVRLESPHLISKIAPPVRLVSLEIPDRAWTIEQWSAYVREAIAGARKEQSLLLVIHADADLQRVLPLIDVALREGFEGVIVDGRPRLVPLVAHDRATLGGMLLAAGWLFLLPALWGFRRGSPWLWWTSLAAGVIAYAAAIGVHYAVGYLNVMHLLPAFGGLALMLVGLILSYPFLCRRE